MVSHSLVTRILAMTAVFPPMGILKDILFSEVLTPYGPNPTKYSRKTDVGCAPEP
ncbi:uncharacterized protein CTRU02_203305 [Colletotrichum truncatum]|uniref:Uncharacterized protein n=1 Tax=Colletotrichum truncatum TaxID=5467 RepID=A0ACC3Z8Y8_COLTU|nr:uncharacterized protein CTRU02_15679 [Colletotrichum truncatum]KAF6780805.1 hypothetical protein CTRU02_15679 [Colletotrichum truncatum]